MIIQVFRERFNHVLTALMMITIIGVGMSSCHLSIELDNPNLFTMEIDFDGELEEDRLSDDKISDPSASQEHLSMISEGLLSRYSHNNQLNSIHHLSISTPPPKWGLDVLLQ